MTISSSAAWISAFFWRTWLAVLAVGYWAARRGKQTKRDYFLSGDKLPWWMIGGSIVASNISSHHLVGVMGTAYHRGFISIVIEWGAILHRVQCPALGLSALLPPQRLLHDAGVPGEAVRHGGPIGLRQRWCC